MRSLTLDTQIAPNGWPAQPTTVIRMQIQPRNGLGRRQTDCQLQLCVPLVSAQDELFARIHHMLRPGAHLVAVDSIDSEPIRQGHIDDTFVPLDPQTLPGRLTAVGFTDVSVQPSGPYQFRFTAAKAA
jgi:hypothetical protein